MDIKRAAQRTKDKIKSNCIYTSTMGCDKEHLKWMLDGIILGYITGEKAHRWLGWAQAIIVVNLNSNLEEMKEEV